MAPCLAPPFERLRAALSESVSRSERILRKDLEPESAREAESLCLGHRGKNFLPAAASPASRPLRGRDDGAGLLPRRANEARSATNLAARGPCWSATPPRTPGAKPKEAASTAQRVPFNFHDTPRACRRGAKRPGQRTGHCRSCNSSSSNDPGLTTSGKAGKQAY